MRRSIAPGAATAAVTAVSAGTALARKVAARRHQGGGIRPQRDVDTARWRAVTVLRRIDEIRQTVPDALASLGPAVEVEVRAAPDGKGSVVAARLVEPQLVDADPTRAVRALRQALRHAKQQLEIGWVVTPSRSEVVPTALNRPLREAEAGNPPAVQGEGVR